MSQLAPLSAFRAPVLAANSGDQACVRYLELFTTLIRNQHTRRAYARVVSQFPSWCESVGA
jgi:hypothetical protein